MADEAERVEAGARFLDAERPQWFQQLDRRSLDLSSPHSCVLGQLEGDYEHGRVEFGLSQGDAADMGFDMEEAGSLDRSEYAELTACWLAEVRDRLAHSGR